jgi:hypothetical protein
MQCYGVLCSVMGYYAVLWGIMQCYGVLCSVMGFPVTWRREHAPLTATILLTFKQQMQQPGVAKWLQVGSFSRVLPRIQLLQLHQQLTDLWGWMGDR